MANQINLNTTNQIVREAMKIVSKDVRAPKVVRQGTVTASSSSVRKIK